MAKREGSDQQHVVESMDDKVLDLLPSREATQEVLDLIDEVTVKVPRSQVSLGNALAETISLSTPMPK